ncbi:hypothetical protein [Roseivivax sp. THAF40]|uniref:hypothetical protein n=1 Tax=Roseivivax sp. THAF40 TaxID=2587858 RepID=UPI001267D457|nr:hypothetical protein [Roseivivax sp. THAF40]
MSAETTAARATSGDFDAEGPIDCVQRDGLPMGRCIARVARAPGGEATIVITFENSFTRTLFFEDSAFLRANTTMSGVGTDTDWRIEEGLHNIRVDDQRFVLPDVLIFGE